MTMKIDLGELAARESEQVEWKENVADIDNVVRTTVAFANDFSNLGGGYIVCGAQETKDEHGFQSLRLPGLTSSRLKEVEGKVMSSCRDFVDPPVVPLTEELPASDPDRRVFVFIVPASKDAHAFRSKDDSGKYYVRIGRETREARNGILRELLVRKGAREPWDRSFHPEADINDIDLVAFRDLLQRIGVWDPNKGIDDYLDPHGSVSPLVPSFCVREPLTGILRPRNYTLLLVGRNVPRLWPEAHAIFSIYPGRDRSEPYSERLEIHGTLVSQIQTLIDRLNTEAYVAMDKTGPETPNVVKYPRRALHEAVVNALAHRDYEARHPVRVTALADRVEMFSPGCLPTAVNPEQFRAGTAMPVWRNQCLAWFLNKLQLAQAEGQGIATILRTMKEEGCPAPEFNLTQESVACVLPAHPRHAQMRELREIERFVALGHLGEAQQKTELLLDQDPYNFRTVQLFCDIQKALQQPEKVLHFVQKHSEHLESFSATAQALLADTLSDFPDPWPPVLSGMIRRLLSMAARGRVEQAEARRLVITLLKLGEEQEALSLFKRLFREQPNLEEAPPLLQLRGRMHYQMAQRCAKTARSWSLSPRMKANAWNECRRYLSDAERDFRAALEHTPDSVVEDYAKRGLEAVERLKEKTKKPERR